MAAPVDSVMYTMTRGGTGTGGQHVAQSGDVKGATNELFAMTTPEVEETQRFE